MTNRLLAWLLVAAFASLGAHAALATAVSQIAPPLIDINGTALDFAALNCSTRGGQWVCYGTNLQGNGYELSSWAFSMNPDPSITGTFTLINLSATTQTFILTVTLPISPSGPSVSITGSIGAGALTDLNANGATLTDDGSSIYTALIHDSPVHTLLDPSQSFSALADPFGMPSTAAIGKVSFGPELLAQSANNTISEKIQFTLTAGDRVILPTVFAVTAVPEPGMLILLASGLACLVTFSRRYSALAARSRGR